MNGHKCLWNDQQRYKKILKTKPHKLENAYYVNKCKKIVEQAMCLTRREKSEALSSW